MERAKPTPCEAQAAQLKELEQRERALGKSLDKLVLDYFKQDFWADTAVFTALPATKAGMEFFPVDKILFASDCPFDPEGGTMFPRETLKILDSLKLDKATSDKIFYKNLEAVTGRTLVS